jgi:hypothetical protein
LLKQSVNKTSQRTIYKINPVDNDIKILSFIGTGKASIIVTNSATISANQPKSGKNKKRIARLIIKKVAEPAKDLSKNFTDSVILPTIAANESAIVKINTAGTAISFLKMKNVTVADMNKYVAPVMCLLFSSSLRRGKNILSNNRPLCPCLNLKNSAIRNNIQIILQNTRICSRMRKE